MALTKPNATVNDLATNYKDKETAKNGFLSFRENEVYYKLALYYGTKDS